MLEATSAFLVFLAVYAGFGFLVVSALRNISASTRIAVSLTLSFWLCFLPTVILSRFHLLNFMTSFVLALMLLGFASWLRWYTGSEPLRLMPNRWLLVALSLVALFHALELRHGESVRGGFFYLSEIKYITDSLGLPEQVTHFGSETEPQVDKLGFTQLGALTSLLSGMDLLVLSRVGYIGSVLLVTLAAFGFFSCFLSAPFAACATVFSFTNLFTSHVCTTRSFFLPENVALIYLFSAATLFRQAAHSQGKDRNIALALSAAASAACLLNHLEIGFLLLLLLGGLTAGSCLSTGKLSSTSVFATNFALLGFLVILSYSLLGVAPDFVKSSLHGEQYSAFRGSDPTYEFLAPYGKHTPFSLTPAPHSVQELLLQGIKLQGRLFHSPLGTLLALGTVLSLGIACLARRKQCAFAEKHVEGWIAAFASVIVIGLVTVWSDRSFSVWVYQTEALRRIVPYCSLGVTWGLFLALDYLAHSGSRTLSRLLGRGAWLVTLLFFLGSLPITHPLPSPFRVSGDGFSVLNYFANNPPAHILTSEVSTGAFHALTPSRALLEGHQPVLRPAMILETLELLEEARSFFRNPEADAKFLRKHQISHLIVTKSVSGDFGGARLLPTNEISPNLGNLSILCNPTASGSIQIFEVCASD